MIVTGIAIPIYLGVVGVRWVNVKYPSAVVLIVVLCAGWLSVLIDYMEWGLFAGSFVRPDPETQVIVQAGIVFGTIISSVPVLIAAGIRMISNRERQM